MDVESTDQEVAESIEQLDLSKTLVQLKADDLIRKLAALAAEDRKATMDGLTRLANELTDDDRTTLINVLQAPRSPGQATTELTPFKRVTGVDPSEKMIEGARSSVASLGLENSAQFDFVQSSAESLEFLEDSTVDLITAGVFRIPLQPTSIPSPAHHRLCAGKDPENSLGPYWQQPGRHILEDHLLAVPEPADILGAERYSNDAEHADGNIATRFWKSLKEGAAVSNDTDEVDIEFPLALLLQPIILSTLRLLVSTSSNLIYNMIRTLGRKP
ncbi:S-adenosyl-L-methionine-dependent methyltransferase [Salix suchowensis]|nr:S-adenosyl-L-methionine-dependent methyltransferase [Salix suchowensis]